jgi:hypothetical protein
MFTMPDPPDGSYPWKMGYQIYGYPLATVFANSLHEAEDIAGGGICCSTYSQRDFIELAIDSTEATVRLGLFARHAEFMEMCRGE